VSDAQLRADSLFDVMDQGFDMKTAAENGAGKPVPGAFARQKIPHLAAAMRRAFWSRACHACLPLAITGEHMLHSL
jgi:hypothetical protein